MTSRKLIMSVAALALMAATPALAEDAGAKVGMDSKVSAPLGTSIKTKADINDNATAPEAGADQLSLTALDSNKNGTISRDEFKSATSIEAGAFADLDTNRDGKLTGAELQAYNNAHIQQE